MEKKESYQMAAKETLKKLVDDKVSPHAVAHGEEGILSDCGQGNLKKLVDGKVSKYVR
jgi:hypothetical protein